MLVVPPDLTGKRVCVLRFTGFIPTELRPKTEDPILGFRITLKPHEKFRVFWDLAPPIKEALEKMEGEAPRCYQPLRPADIGTLRGWFWDFTDALSLAGFVPGPYNFTVEGKAYVPVAQPGAAQGTNASQTTLPAQLAPEQMEYHTFIESADINMEIPQLLVVLGAVLGGCLGFLVAATGSNGDFWTYVSGGKSGGPAWLAWTLVYKLISAALLSIIVTILLSRLSDTQFAIKVSVADFWGAITVGFMGYFLGGKLIDQIVTKLGPKSPPTPPISETTPPTITKHNADITPKQDGESGAQQAQTT